MRIKSLLVPILLALFASFLFAGVVQAGGGELMPAPTLLKISDYKSYSLPAPVISGVSPAGASVLVFVDGVFAGNAKVKKSGGNANSFYYQVFGLSEGLHKAYLVSEDEVSLERSLPSAEFDLIISTLPAPTLIKPDENTITGNAKTKILGFTKSGSFVHLYIDGIYNGKTSFVEDESGTAHFSYVPFQGLRVGSHKMWAVSEDVNGRKSQVSAVQEFRIEPKMPAPVVLKKPNLSDRMLTGVAKNDSRIRVYVDKKFDGEFLVRNHPSGTASFYYYIKTKNLRADSLVFVTASDKRGKESEWSNLVWVGPRSQTVVSNFPSSTPSKQPAISGEGVSEEKPGLEQVPDKQEPDSVSREKIKDYLVFADLYEKDDQLRLSDSQYEELAVLIETGALGMVSTEEADALKKLLASRDIEKKNEETKDAENIEGENKEDESSKEEDQETASTSGAIDEKKESQSRIGWNAIIFIIFLVAVIAWIFWVNRELIKEKREQEEKERQGKNEEEKK
jgi:hypothetical protein